MKPIPAELWQRRYDNPEALRSALPRDSGREWLICWLPSRAHDNGMFILFTNDVGLDHGEVRTGNGMILDPYGRNVEETDSFEDTMISAELDLSLPEMSTERRWVHGQRPELYEILNEHQGYERDVRNTRFSTKPPSFDKYSN